MLEEGKLSKFGTFDEIKDDESVKHLIVDLKKENKDEDDTISEDKNSN